MNIKLIMQAMIQDLRDQLSQFGLNPNEWILKIKTVKDKNFVLVQNRLESSIQLLGEFILHKENGLVKVALTELSLADI